MLATALRAPVTGNVRGHMDAGTKFTVAMVVLGAYVLGINWLQHRASPELRKKYIKVSAAGTGVIFLLGVLWAANPEWSIILILLPIIALFSYLHYRMVSVCATCGEVIWVKGLTRQKSCSNCGGALKV
jgi:hypothetical protein